MHAAHSTDIAKAVNNHLNTNMHIFILILVIKINVTKWQKYALYPILIVKKKLPVNFEKRNTSERI